MKKAILAIVLVAGLLNPLPAQAKLTECKDGTYSSSTGRGTCSRHGGIATSAEYKKIVAKIKKKYGITINDQGQYSAIQLAAAAKLLARQKANSKIVGNK
jgi:hypothetical protein